MLKSEIYVPVARRNILYGVVVFLFLVLLGKLYYLQIYQYERFRELADYNRIRMVTTYAPRGRILDRKGTILAANQSVYTISVIRNELVDEKREIDLIARYLRMETGTIQANLQRYYRGPFVPARVARDVPLETLGYLEEHRNELPGVIYSDFPVRFYPERVRPYASHILGYLREISRDELNQVGNSGYDPGDFVGAQGIEKRYESRLRGSKGVVYQLVDVLGRVLGPVKDREPVPAVPGEDIFLTVDASLQAYVESILGDRTGAAVVLNARTGEVLALASKPDYKLEDFAGFMKGETWNRYATDESKPLLNRAVQGRYPPGSAMKLITAIAALENDLVDPDWTVECTGTYRFGDRDFSCWKPEGHGTVNLSRAITESCNVYFYHLIQRMDLNLWYRYARMFGFGQKTGIDLPEEAKGTVPGRRFMDRKYGKGRWTRGYLLNIAIGQGDILVTPIQMARYIALVATRGKPVTPWLAFVEQANGDQGEPVGVNLKASTWDMIHKLTFNVVNSPNGTGFGARVADPRIRFHGKTGTAENPHGEPHAWFVGFATRDDESIALAVLVEHGGTGGTAAAPLAGKIVSRYFGTTADILTSR